MKKISLMRHCDAPYLHTENDLNRTLSYKGKQEAKDVGKALNEKYKIDLIISSDAERAIETANIISNTLNQNTKYEIDQRIYQGVTKKILEEIIALYKENDHMLLVGHNPSILECVLEIFDKNDKDYDAIANQNMTTGKTLTFKVKKNELENYKYIFDGIIEPF